MRGKPGNPNTILEVNDIRPTTLHMASASNVYCTGFNPDGNSISIKGKYLENIGLAMPKILYRFSRVANLPTCYSFLTLNCDIVANWLQGGQPNWTTKMPESNLAFIVDYFRRADPGVVTLATLYNIEAGNNSWVLLFPHGTLDAWRTREPKYHPRGK